MNKRSGYERRRYFRLGLKTPLCAKMTLAMVNNKIINTGTSEVCIEDIGPGGLRFLSHLRIPSNPSITLGFQMNISHELLYVHGKIVREIEIQPGIYEYGVKFNVSESKRDQIIMLVNALAIAIKRKWSISHSSLCSKSDKIVCLFEKSIG
jgi:hypothetical protein